MKFLPVKSFLRFAAIGLVASLGVPSVRAAEAEYPEFVEQVYLTPPEALKKAFPKSEKIVEETVRLTPLQKDRVEKRLGWRLTDEPYVVYKGVTGGQVDGYAVIAEEIGKYKPITFLVKVLPQGEVDMVEVLVYREPRGGEVRTKRFLQQLRGKNAKSPLRINRDIINITGATLSVRAMAAGVKRVLIVVDEVYGTDKKR